MAEMEEGHMSAYLLGILAGARNVLVGRLRENVRTLSVAHFQTVCFHFFIKFVVLIHRRRIIFSSNDALKILPDERLGDCFG